MKDESSFSFKSESKNVDVPLIDKLGSKEGMVQEERKRKDGSSPAKQMDLNKSETPHIAGQKSKVVSCERDLERPP